GGVLRKLALPSFKEEASMNAGRKCAWLSRSKEGLLLTVSEGNEVWLLDPDNLQVKWRFQVPGLTRAVSCPQISIGFVAAGGSLHVVDLARQRTVQQYQANNLARLLDFQFPAVSADGRYLYVMGAVGQMFRLRCAGGRIQVEESGPGIGSNPQALEISP